MKLGIKRVGTAIVDGAAGIVFVTRCPRTDKSIRIMTIMWALAALLAVWSVGLFLGSRDFGNFFLYLNAGCLVLDAYMLRHCVLGLRYRRSRRGKVSRRALP